MLPIKKIICPIDFSERSYHALEQAGDLAEHFKAELIAVHVVSPIPEIEVPMQQTTFDVAEYHEYLGVESEKVLEKAVKEKVPSGVDSRKVIAKGKPAEQIERISKEEKADLIVMSTQGHSAVGQILFGSVADHVLRHSMIPVLTIRALRKEE